MSEVPDSALSPTGGTGAVSDRKKTPTSWDPHDDMLLRHLKEQLKLGWKEIAANFPNRTTNACQFRWRRLTSGNLRSAKNPVPTNPHESITSFKCPSPSSTAPMAIPGHMRENEIPPMMANDTTGYYSRSVPTNTKILENSIWSREEDELLASRKDLRPEELSLLLPGRSEPDIISRAGQLNFGLPRSPSPLYSPASSSVSGYDSSRDRSSSVSSFASSASMAGSSSRYSYQETGRRPTLTKPRSLCLEGLKKLPVPVCQRPSPGTGSFSYSATNTSSPSDWALASNRRPITSDNSNTAVIGTVS